ITFKFPVEPKPVETTSGTTAKRPTRVYERKSFMDFSLMVVEGPSDFDAESNGRGTGVMLNIRDTWLEKLKSSDPKIIKDVEIAVDGHPGRFVHVETNDGYVYRTKIFLTKNRLYYAFVVVKKGERHGFNWENDFEMPATAFLDSIHLITK